MVVKTEDDVQENRMEEADSVFEPTVIIKSQTPPKIQLFDSLNSLDDGFLRHCCCMCQKTFSESDFLSHVTSMHSQTIIQNTQKQYTKKQSRECQHCKRKFRLKRSLDDHIWVPNFQEAPRDRTNEYKQSKKQKLKQSLTQSLKPKRPSLREKICTYCGKVLKNLHCLREHEFRTHAEEFPIPCTHPGCTKMFAAEAILKTHLITHGEKKYICDVSDSEPTSDW